MTTTGTAMAMREQQTRSYTWHMGKKEEAIPGVGWSSAVAPGDGACSWMPAECAALASAASLRAIFIKAMYSVNFSRVACTIRPARCALTQT